MQTIEEIGSIKPIPSSNYRKTTPYFSNWLITQQIAFKNAVPVKFSHTSILPLDESEALKSSGKCKNAPK
jgi:hypothetical protein